MRKRGDVSYRGSASGDASNYKKGGHTNEELFSDLIGGSTKNLPPQGKTDVKDRNGLNYSVKGLNKKWQIFLYSPNRIAGDQGFQELAKSGFDLRKMQACFPSDYSEYTKAKVVAKRIWADLRSENSGLRVEETPLTENLYVKSKMSLGKATAKLKQALDSERILGEFIEKSLFNGKEVQRFAIGGNRKFSVFEASEVVAFLASKLTPRLSGTGGHWDDISIPGQKMLLWFDSNILELEVRNDSESKYRSLRLNMISSKAIKLLLDNSRTVHEENGVSFKSLNG